MRRIPVTRDFDPTQPIGYLELQDDVDIPIDSVFSFSYAVQERAENGDITKIIVEQVSLIPDNQYAPYRKNEGVLQP